MEYGKGWGDPTKYGVPEGWEFVGPDRTTKQHFFLRCKECGVQHSLIKYQLGKTHDCWNCWYVNKILSKPHLWSRIASVIGAFAPKNGRNEIEELECLYVLPDPRQVPNLRRLTGLDWEQPSVADSVARWERIERDILLEANRRHDAEHAEDPWFRLLRQ